jgi:prepilin-type N-terminal cleavage/methylation domain-containing protein
LRLGAGCGRRRFRLGGAGPCAGSAKRRAFTLVEVIVVLVILAILAILAAIAIPSLTGYIDKAQEKQYIAEARNFAVAVRTVLDEAYADGKLASVDITTGGYPNLNPNRRQFYPPAIYQSEAAKLADTTLFNAATPSVPGIQEIRLNGPINSTMLTAGGFICIIRPDGSPGPSIYVIYGLPRLPIGDFYTDFVPALGTAVCDTSTYGYEVYYW